MSRMILFGWDAPSIGEQCPELSATDAEHFDKDSKAISRLAVRGIISREQRDKAAVKLTRQINEALSQTEV